MDELPEPWRTAAEQAGVRQSLRGLADAAGVGHPTIKRLIAEGRTSPKTVQAVADALAVTVERVEEWAGMEPATGEPWNPPDAARRLSPRARAALTELILAITDERGGTDANTAEAGEKIDEADDRPVSLQDAKRRRLQARTQQRRKAADSRPARADHDDN